MRPRQAVASLVLAAAVVGCGSAKTPVPPPPPRPTTPVAVDCSPSMAGRQDDWAAQISKVAASALAADMRFMAGCFAGEPASVKWSFDLDGVSIPKVTGGAVARRRWAVAWASKLTPLFSRRLVPDGTRGTNWLGALQSSAQVPGARKVYLFSDLVQQAGGVNLLRSLSDRELQAIAAGWAPKLTALRGMTVFAIGGGLGTQHPEAADRGRTLLRMLARAVPFDVRVQTVVQDPPPV